MVVERSVSWQRLIVILVGGIRIDNADMSSNN